MRQQQCRAPNRLDHLGHRERLARSGYPQQNLVRFAVAHTAYQFVDGGCLVALGSVVDREVEAHLYSIGNWPTCHQSVRSD